MGRRGQDQEDILRLRLRRCEDVVCEAVGEGAVALHARTGVYYELDQVGLLVWEQCAGHRDGYAAAAQVAAEYGIPGETAEADVRAFLRQLLQARMVEPAGEPKSPQPPGRTGDSNS
jgi:hypothetical protein